MIIKPFFNYCPMCKSNDLCFEHNNHYVCKECKWEYFHNTATAAGALLYYRNKVIFIVRKNEPAKGKLTIPGGFVNPGETSEEACRREIREEVGIELNTIHYFGSYANQYPYKGILYFTCDIIYWAVIDTIPDKHCTLEVEEITLQDPACLDPEVIAFISVKQLIRDLVKNNPGTHIRNHK